MRRFLLVHYGELGLKGSNKPYFLKKLIQNLRIKLDQRFSMKHRIVESLERIFIDLPENFIEKEYEEVVSKVFGVRNFQFVFEGSLDFEKASEQIWGEFLKIDRKFENFRVRVKRSQKMPKNSAEMERELGSYLIEKGINLPVKLKNADLEINLEILNEHIYFSFEKFEGAGGLPWGTGAKMLSLISSGIDSPVASFRLMRRGVKVSFVHFHGYPYTDDAERDQVRDLVKILSEYQMETRLHLVSFGKYQKEIATNLKIPAKYRTVLYRRLMLKIANEMAYRNKSKGLVTGDNYGQVASQTGENLFTIDEAARLPVYRPLIGFDKEDVVRMAEEIGTFEISKLPCKDTCRMFMPRSPELKANVVDAKEFEKLLPLDEWVEEAISGSELLESF